MQLKEHNLCENGGDINENTDCLESHDNFELEHESDNIPNGLKTPKLQSTMEDTKEILELLQRATRTVEILPKGMEEVYPSLFIGNQYAALDKATLKDSGITHVLNVAQGKDLDCVDSNELYYSDVEISFLGISLTDSPRVRIYQFFRPAVTFIHQALADGGKVLVLSKLGLSRASTLACSYLMIKQQQTVKETLLQIQKFRNVLPNRGFISQLLELEWRRSSFMKELRNLQITGIGESNVDVESKNNGVKSSLDSQCHEKDSLDKIRKLGITGISEKIYCEEQNINRTNECLKYETNEVEGLIDCSFCRTDEVKNSKEMSENGSHSAKEFENKKNINNSQKRQEFCCTPSDVLAAIKAVPISRKMLDRITSLEPNIDEVYPGIYIGNHLAALDKPFLKEARITHILNAAQGEGLAFVDTNEKFYQDLDISFLGVRIPESPHVRIFHIFTKTYAFIEECLCSGGKILIHSMQGTSRATTIACSYIMVKENWSVKDSLMSIGQVRVTLPNRGFISQLYELERRKKYLFKDQICKSNLNRSHNSPKNGIIGTKDLTEFKGESSFKMESDKGLENKTQEPVESREPHENRTDSSNDSGRKIFGVKHKDISDSQSQATTVSEILRKLKAIAVESDIKRKVLSTEPDIAEVYPGLYVGNQYAALDKSLLKHSGITHVLNAAHGKDSDFVNTGEQYYQAECIKLFSLKLPDSPNSRIVNFFKPTFDFIRTALANGGKVLVHSKRGISRAPTIACCYIMLTEQKSCIESLIAMSRVKTVLPNRGFIAQLIELEWRRGSILKDSMNSVGKTQTTLDLGYDCKPHLVEVKEESHSKTNPQDIKESKSCVSQLLHENLEKQINEINNFKHLQIPDVCQTENFELDHEKRKPLDAMSSIIKTTEVMCVLKDMSMAETMADNVIVDNPSVKCTQTCMWEINMLL